MGIDLNLMEVILTVSESVVRGDRVRRHLNQEKAEGELCEQLITHTQRM